MSDNKMLQAILSGQAQMREDIKEMRKEMKDGFKKVSERMDKIGSQVAYLEDDAPTREEHDGLEKRVTKLEQLHT